MKKIIVIIVIVLGLVIAGGSTLFALYGFSKDGGPIDKATGQPVVAASSDCVTPLLPKINDPAAFATAINNYIAATSPKSPFIGMGQTFVEAGTKNNINPAWEVNIARKESSIGIATPPNSNNAYGRTATASQPNISYNGRLWYKYDSFQASIEPQAEYLNQQYIAQGLTTIDTITNKYAPPSENDTTGYIAQMKDWIGQLMAQAGSSVSCISL